MVRKAIWPYRGVNSRNRNSFDHLFGRHNCFWVMYRTVFCGSRFCLQNTYYLDYESLSVRTVEIEFLLYDVKTKLPYRKQQAEKVRNLRKAFVSFLRTTPNSPHQISSWFRKRMSCWEVRFCWMSNLTSV